MVRLGMLEDGPSLRPQPCCTVRGPKTSPTRRAHNAVQEQLHEWRRQYFNHLILCRVLSAAGCDVNHICTSHRSGLRGEPHLLGRYAAREVLLLGLPCAPPVRWKRSVRCLYPRLTL
eukprot:scaffold23427_cov68-Phaeocystis_antarctica.AAC.4